MGENEYALCKYEDKLTQNAVKYDEMLEVIRPHLDEIQSQITVVERCIEHYGFDINVLDLVNNEL